MDVKTGCKILYLLMLIEITRQRAIYQVLEDLYLEAEKKAEAKISKRLSYPPRGDDTEKPLTAPMSISEQWKNYKLPGRNETFVKLQLDMIISKDSWNEIMNSESNIKRGKRNAVKEPYKLWPHRIPYRIIGGFNQTEKNLIVMAMQQWEENTCLKFVEAKRSDFDVIEFIRPKKDLVCESMVGRTQGPQPINLAAGCMYSEILVHEIGHALGLYDEHMRADRDDYVTIYYQNIKQRSEHEFTKLLNTSYNSYGKPYDYESIMHCGKTFFSSNRTAGLLTIVPKDSRYLDVIGNRTSLSFYDVKIINEMYECAEHCNNTDNTNKTCPDDSFFGQDCECFCKGNTSQDSIVPCHPKDFCGKLNIDLGVYEVLNRDFDITSLDYMQYDDGTLFHVQFKDTTCGSDLTNFTCVGKSWIGKLPKCERCDVSDIPTNRFTLRTPDRSHIMHDETIVYRCTDYHKDLYELYVKSTDSFPGTFNSTCSFGDFDVLKQNFPMCVERRCDITYQTSVFANACFWTSDDHGGKCLPEGSKIHSRLSVNIRCGGGHELYNPIKAEYLDVESSEMRCEKGHYLKDLSCKQRRCDITYRTSAFANACFWQDNDHGRKCKPENFKISSRSSVNIRCNDGYELYDTKQAKYLDVERSEIRCERGQFIPDLSCKESPPNVTVQLTGGYHGRVEIRVYDKWGTICDDGFGDNEATVICRMLGHHSGGTVLTRGSYGRGSGPILLDDVKCAGNETRIQYCVHKPWGNNNCWHSNMVAVLCHSVQGPTNVTVRLAGGLSIYHGRVEIRVYDMWGTICDNGFGDTEATVICRMLGHHRGGTALTRGSYSEGSGPIWLTGLNCSGNKTRLQDCIHMPWGRSFCGHDKDVAVLCHSAQGPTNVTVRLAGGLSIYHGRVEIRVYDMWGSICDNGFGDTEATVICRMLGHHRGGTALTRGSYSEGSGPIWLTGLNCSGNETRLQDCIHKPWGRSFCRHDKDVAVLCHSAQDSCLPPNDVPIIKVSKEFYVTGEIIESDQFVCPTNHVLMPRNGMICLHGKWTKTAKCIPNDQRDTIDDPFNEVICGLRPMELISEKKLESLRIIGGSTATNGLHPWQVGFRLKDRTFCGGTILSEYWILSAAHCFKKSLIGNVTVRIGDHDNNHPDEFEQEFELEHRIIHGQYNESTADYDLALLKIQPKNGEGIKFGKQVQPACIPNQTSSYVEGKQCHVSGWGTTIYPYTSYPDMLQSAIVLIINDETCQRLYTSQITPRMFCAGYLDGRIDTCKGDSGGPMVCDINSRYTVMGATSWGNGCGSANKPGVYARVTELVPWIKENVKKYSVNIRLSGGASSSEGRVEVFYNNTWGTVCDDYFDTNAAAVVCRMLGLPSSGAEPRFYGSGNGTIWLDNVRCKGNETSIVDCNANRWGNNDCGHSEDVGVFCAEGPPNVTVQLTGGPSIFHGRVEIRVYDMWGTICDDGFGDKEAIVICRMLGHHSGGTVQTRGSYGGGSGPIWLDDVKCSGNETRIQDCVHRPWGSNNCGHDTDVAVLCHSLQDQPDDCFEYIPKLYPFSLFRTDAFFIGEGISMNETKCKMECLHGRGKTCNGVFHHSRYDVNGTLQYSSCWGFEEDKRYPPFYRNNKIQHSRYFVRTCAPQKR